MISSVVHFVPPRENHAVDFSTHLFPLRIQICRLDPQAICVTRSDYFPQLFFRSVSSSLGAVQTAAAKILREFPRDK